MHIFRKFWYFRKKLIFRPNFQIVKSVKLVDRFIFFWVDIADAYANNPTEQNLSISFWFLSKLNSFFYFWSKISPTLLPPKKIWKNLSIELLAR